MVARLASLLLAAALPLTAYGDDALQARLQHAVEHARDGHGIPAIAAMVLVHGVTAAAVSGIRAAGHEERATLDDQWSIGSDTKAFTATMIARLSESGVLSLDETLGRALPALASTMDPAYRKVTVAQLLSHTAGLPSLTDDKDLPAFLRIIRGEKDVTAQRAAAARAYLARPPASRIGEYAYSNLDYIVAGSIAEARTGRSWEDLLRAEIFAPLGITHAGFGPPGTPGRFDQPHGHRVTSGTLAALDPGDPSADNPPALGPAGTMHITLADWMRFAQDQLDGMHGGGKLLKPETYRRLHTPVADSYALGWGTGLASDKTPVVLAHTGSNGYWLADIRIDARRDAIVLIAMNAASPAAFKALEELAKDIREALPPH
jgi:D-alanyl-D-alanine carboxypeptidase